MPSNRLANINENILMSDISNFIILIITSAYEHLNQQVHVALMHAFTFDDNSRVTFIHGIHLGPIYECW